MVVAFAGTVHAQQQGDTTIQYADTSYVVSFVASDSTAPADTSIVVKADSLQVKVTWEKYAEATSLTYQQIVTICDSLFAMEGQDKPLPTGDTEEEEEAREAAENSPYTNYCTPVAGVSTNN